MRRRCGRHAGRCYMRLESMLGHDDWAWSAGATAARGARVDGCSTTCAWTSAERRGQRVHVWRWGRSTPYGGAERHERRGPMMRCLCRRLAGRPPGPGGSMLGHAVLAWQARAVAGRLQVWSLTTCKVRWVRRGQGPAARTSTDGGAMGPGPAPSAFSKRDAVGNKNWKCVAGTNGGPTVVARLTSVFCDLAVSVARSQERRGGSWGGSSPAGWAAERLTVEGFLRALRGLDTALTEAGMCNWYVCGN